MAEPAAAVHGKDSGSDRPGLAEDEVRELHTVFRGAVTQLLPVLGDRSEFWYTWLASRCRIGAGLWSRLVILFRVRQALREGAPLPECDDPLLAQPVATLCARYGRPSPCKRARTPLRVFGLRASVLRAGLRMLVWVLLARRLPRRTQCDRPPDAVIVSFLSEASLEDRGVFRDTYFGILHGWLADHGERPLHLGLIQQNLIRVMAALKARRRADAAVPVRAAAEYALVGDVRKAVGRALTMRFEVPQILWEGCDLSGLVRADLENDRAIVAETVFLERIWQRLMSRWPHTRFLQMWENNPWEKALYVAARGSGATCDGYLHTVVIPAHIKYWMAEADHGVRPMPRRLICAGEESRRRLAALGSYPDGCLASGCMLRDTLPDAAPRQDLGSRPVHRILVILEGLPTMVPILRFAEEAAQRMPDTRFEVRAHPVFGLDRLGPMAGISFGADRPLRPSPRGSFVDVLERFDICLYQGSMAAVTALYLGIPVIKYRADALLDDDPLSGCPALHAQIDDFAGLESAVAAFEALGSDVFPSMVGEARTFVTSLMAVPSSETLAPFLGGPGARRRPAPGVHLGP